MAKRDPQIDVDDALLAEVLAGERSFDDAQVQALLARRPEVQAEIIALGPMASQLSARGAERRAELGATPTAADIALARAAVDAERRPVRRHWGWVCAAAAAAAVLVWALVGPGFGSAADPVESDPWQHFAFTTLDGDQGRCEVVEVDDEQVALVVTATAAPPDGDGFRFYLSVDGIGLEESPVLPTPRWVLAKARLERMGDAISWQCRIVGASGPDRAWKQGKLLTR